MLGPLAFVIFINDLDNEAGLITIINKFADDTRLGQRISIEEDKDNLQDCLTRLANWASMWSMEFNVKKCKVLHVGRNNKKFEYFMNGEKLDSLDSERDIGVIIDKSLKPSLQCAEAARRASSILTQITRAFHYRDRNTFLKLYIQFVRCHVEFSIPAWSPWSQGDIDILERVQKRAVNLITGLKGKSYLEKLQEIGLVSLEARRSRFDLVQTFKIIKGFNRVNRDIWFEFVGPDNPRPTRLTSHQSNIIPKRSRTDPRLNFFSNRVVNSWNTLPAEIKDAKSLNMFKNSHLNS